MVFLPGSGKNWSGCVLDQLEFVIKGAGQTPRALQSSSLDVTNCQYGVIWRYF